MNAKQQYQQAQHAMRYLRLYGNTIVGHDYFLRRIRTIPVEILQKAWAGL